jgi:hypothetical protein
LAAVSSKPGKTARTRWRKSSIAGDSAKTSLGIGFFASGRGSGGTGNWCSPPRRSGARLVASTVSPGHAPKRSATRGAAPMRCSKLSINSSICVPCRCCFRVSRSVRPATSLIPIASARAEGRRSGSFREARGTKATPSANAPRKRSATSTASRVLPTPPGPVRVNRRTSTRCRRRATVVASSSRPIKGVIGKGMVWGKVSAVARRMEGRRAAASKLARS